MYPIITISREFGSGGHTIGERVAKELGLPFYDSEIVAKVAEETGFDEKEISTSGEYTSKAANFFNTLNEMSSRVPYESRQDKIFAAQSKVIIEAAKKGPCVIVGRCADYILKQSGFRSLNVFIHADMDYRKDHVVSSYGANDVSIEKRLRKKDKDRTTYYKYYTDEQWGDYRKYALSLDTGILGPDKCVEIIVNVAKQMSQ